MLFASVRCRWSRLPVSLPSSMWPMHDSLHTSQVSKFVYGRWRPVTAIREAELDLNPETEPDADWLPLLPTPPYPAYAGNAASSSAAAARALGLALGTDDIPVSATWRQTGGLPDVTHHFASFSQAAEEHAISRMWGGIHMRTDAVAGLEIGTKVAEFVFANYMRLRAGTETRLILRMGPCTGAS